MLLGSFRSDSGSTGVAVVIPVLVVALREVSSLGGMPFHCLRIDRSRLLESDSGKMQVLGGMLCGIADAVVPKARPVEDIA